MSNLFGHGCASEGRLMGADEQRKSAKLGVALVDAELKAQQEYSKNKLTISVKEYKALLVLQNTCARLSFNNSCPKYIKTALVESFDAREG